MISYLNNYFVTMFGIGYIKKIPGNLNDYNFISLDIRGSGFDIFNEIKNKDDIGISEIYREKF